jgi:hypothetical protein
MLRVVTVLVAAAVTGVLAGCGSSGGPQQLPSAAAPVSRPSATSAAPSPALSIPPSVVASTGFPAEYAVPCAGRPGADQVITVLWSAKVLPSRAPATTTIGPLCSADWQYTALDVPGTGLLQVLTRGPSGALRLVTAGTDVCTATVKAQAPAGIRTVARC